MWLATYKAQKRSYLEGNLPTEYKECKISDIMKISNIIKIILQFHETLSGVVASQTKMQFDFIRRINVTRCKYPLVHIVAR